MLENHSCALVEHLTLNNKIEGYNPALSTKKERDRDRDKRATKWCENMLEKELFRIEIFLAHLSTE
jgi:hypothetical protein